MNVSLVTRFHPSIDELDAAAWDALRADANPFVAHAFLSALEHTDCIRREWGWQPHHLGLYQSGELLAAAPLYLKTNSHGEYVFDFSWANAWQNVGGQYYPKLLNAVPYSPVTGPRLLAGNSAQTPALQRALVEAMQQEAQRLGLSSVHADFLEETELSAFDEVPPAQAWLARSDVQFHWHNRGYRHFPAFLAALAHKKRKNILRERSAVAASGLLIEMRSGDSLSTAEWQQIHTLYTATFDTKGNTPTLTAAFFQQLGTMGENVQVALARQDETIVAMALFLRSEQVLYGRYWGTAVNVPGLHFELCYYRGIDYAIAQQLERFEPGAQGEHKLARGFLPARTHSRHYVVDPGFRSAVAEALKHEAEAVDAYAEDLQSHSPYAEVDASSSNYRGDRLQLFIGSAS
ncbi:MAG: GNAT family N-acetyltransferase [Rhodanobacter sp.]